MIFCISCHGACLPILLHGLPRVYKLTGSRIAIKGSKPCTSHVSLSLSLFEAYHRQTNTSEALHRKVLVFPCPVTWTSRLQFSKSVIRELCPMCCRVSTGYFPLACRSSTDSAHICQSVCSTINMPRTHALREKMLTSKEGDDYYFPNRYQDRACGRAISQSRHLNKGLPSQMCLSTNRSHAGVARQTFDELIGCW